MMLFKYEYFDQDLDIKKKIGYQEIITLGANYFFNLQFKVAVELPKQD